MDREQALRKIEELREFIEKVDNNQIDFSQWVGRDDNILSIKGEKYLKSLSNGGIHHSNFNIDNYVDPINYEIVTWGDLKQGDVFIEDKIQKPELQDFNIFTGVDSTRNYRIQYLNNISKIEFIDNTYYIDNVKEKKVKRFLRE